MVEEEEEEVEGEEGAVATSVDFRARALLFSAAAVIAAAAIPGLAAALRRCSARVCTVLKVEKRAKE